MKKDGKGQSDGSADRANKEEPRLVAGRNRPIQEARSGGRKLFKGKLKRHFLEWFAATANCKWSADRVGISYKTVWKHRMKYPEFSEAFDRALDQGAARVRAKLLETKVAARAGGKAGANARDASGAEAIDGDWDAPELQEIDPQVGLTLLREYGHGLSGPSPLGRPAKAGRAPRVASNAEVEAALAKRLKIYAARVKASGDGPSPASPGAGDMGGA